MTVVNTTTAELVENCFFAVAIESGTGSGYCRGMLAEDSSIPAPYERGDKTREEEAKGRGISTRYLRQQMAEERERERVAAEIRAARGDGPGCDDIPHVIITDDPAREQGSWPPGVDRGWYEPESGDCSVDSGRIRIGDHGGRRLLVRAVNGGREAEEPTRQHKPDPDGLKGGKD